MVADWLEAERTRVAVALSKSGLPLQCEVHEPIGLAEGSRVTFRRETVRVSSIILPQVVKFLREDPGTSDPAELSRVASEIGARFGEAAIPTRVLLIGDGYIALLRRLLSEYLTKLSSLGTGDQQLADQLSSDLIALLASPTLISVTSLPVGGLEFDRDSVSAGRVTARRLTPEELGCLAGDARLPSSRSLSRPFLPHWEPCVERWLLEFRTTVPKDTQPGLSCCGDRVVLALQLLGYEPYGAGRATQRTEPSPNLLSMGAAFSLPKRGEDKVCTESDLYRAVALAEAIPEDAIRAPVTTQHVALHRFRSAVCGTHDPDVLIDLAVALEALLLSGTRSGGLSFKFALFGAHHVGSSQEERESLFKEFKQLYNLRSTLVHGSTPPPATEVRAMVKRARELTGRALVRALEVGWPTKGEFQRMALERA